MIHEEESLKRSLIDLAYLYYPYDLSDNEERYYHSKEHLNLKEARTNSKFVADQWDLLLTKIRDNYQSGIYKIEDWRETATVDRCFVGRLVISDTRQGLRSCLVFCVSFVAPAFVIYEAYNQKRDFAIPPILEEHYNTISQFINEQFPNYINLPASLAMIELDNIVFDGLGVLSTWKSDILKKMTLFNAFFSNSFY